MNSYESPAIRKRLELNKGVRTLRNPEFIKLNTYKSDYAHNSAFNWACRAFNFAALYVDPTLPTIEFKKGLERVPDISFKALLTI